MVRAKTANMTINKVCVSVAGKAYMPNNGEEKNAPFMTKATPKDINKLMMVIINPLKIEALRIERLEIKQGYS